MANTLTFANRTLTDANIFGGIHFLADLNTGEEFTIGNTASASVSFMTDIQLPLYTKDATNGKFTWTQDSTSRGRYFITEVTKEADRYNVTAYDAMYLLETNISALSIGFPLTVSAAASAIANYIGCTVSGTVTNGSLPVSELEEDMTIRELLGFVAEASGCSVKIDGSDHLCFMYYADSGITITDSQYKEFGLEVADYTCAAIDKVSILNSVGATIATAGSGSNTLYIEGNPFMENASSTHASAVYAKVNGFSYAPLTCEMFGEYGLEVGTIATFGSTPTLVMHLESSEEGATASSVGSDTRAEYNKSFETMLAEATERALDAADDASKIATDYVAKIDNNGIFVSPSSQSPTDSAPGNSVRINGNGMEVFKGGTSVAQYGDTSRVGKTSDYNIQTSNSAIKFYKNSVHLGDILSYQDSATLAMMIRSASTDASSDLTFILLPTLHTASTQLSSVSANDFAETKITATNSQTSQASGITVHPNTIDIDSPSITIDGTLEVNNAKVPTRNQICYANSRVDNFVNGQITLSLSSLGITTGAKPVGILLTYQDGGATPTILRYDYDASSASGVVIKAYNSSGGAVSGNVRYFALVFQNSWTSVS